MVILSKKSNSIMNCIMHKIQEIIAIKAINKKVNSLLSEGSL